MGQFSVKIMPLPGSVLGGNQQSVAVARVVSQSSDAAFHCVMSSGLVQHSQTTAIGALTLVSMAIFMVAPSFAGPAVSLSFSLSAVAGDFHWSSPVLGSPLPGSGLVAFLQCGVLQDTHAALDEAIQLPHGLCSANTGPD